MKEKTEPKMEGRKHGKINKTNPPSFLVASQGGVIMTPRELQELQEARA